MFEKLINVSAQMLIDCASHSWSKHKQAQKNALLERLFELTGQFEAAADDPLLPHEPLNISSKNTSTSEDQALLALNAPQTELLRQYEQTFLEYVRLGGHLYHSQAQPLVKTSALFWRSEFCMRQLGQAHVLSEHQWQSAYKMLSTREASTCWSQSALQGVLMHHLHQLEHTLGTYFAMRPDQGPHMHVHLSTPSPAFHPSTWSTYTLAPTASVTPTCAFPSAPSTASSYLTSSHVHSTDVFLGTSKKLHQHTLLNDSVRSQMSTLLPLLMHARQQNAWHLTFGNHPNVHYALVLYLQERANQPPSQAQQTEDVLYPFLVHHGSFEKLKVFLNHPAPCFLFKKYLLKALMPPTFCNWYFSQGPHPFSDTPLHGTLSTESKTPALPSFAPTPSEHSAHSWTDIKQANRFGPGTQNGTQASTGIQAQDLASASPDQASAAHSDSKLNVTLSEHFALLHFLHKSYGVSIDPNLAAIYAAQRGNLWDLQSALYMGATLERPLALTFSSNHNPHSWRSTQVYEQILGDFKDDILADQALLDLNVQTCTPLLAASHLPAEAIEPFFQYALTTRKAFCARAQTCLQTDPKHTALPSLMPLFTSQGTVAGQSISKLCAPAVFDAKIEQWCAQLLARLPKNLSALQGLKNPLPHIQTPEELLESASLQLIDLCALRRFYEHYYTHQIATNPTHKSASLAQHTSKTPLEGLDPQSIFEPLQRYLQNPLAAMLFARMEQTYLDSQSTNPDTSPHAHEDGFKHKGTSSLSRRL